MTALKTSRYQIVVLGPGAGAQRPHLEASVQKRAADLSPDVRENVVFFDVQNRRNRRGGLPTVGVYFGGTEHNNPEDISALNELLGEAVVIVPVVDQLSSYPDLTPPELHPINGVERNPSDPTLGVITNLVLENLGLLRRSRRLFLSYRRAESIAVARQLYDALAERGYDVFLDTHSVPKADPFQEVLWHRLADCDLMVMLDTPDYFSSRFTTEEFARAEAMTVGVLQVIWPGHRPQRQTELSFRHNLRRRDFIGRRRLELRGDAIDRVASDVELLRARSVGARHSNLVLEYCREAIAAGATVAVQPERIVRTVLGAKVVAAVPALGAPDAVLYHEANRWLDNGYQEAVLVYDARGLRPQWLEFLAWLDRFLPVKTLRVTDTLSRLSLLIQAAGGLP